MLDIFCVKFSYIGLHFVFGFVRYILFINLLILLTKFILPFDLATSSSNNMKSSWPSLNTMLSLSSCLCASTFFVGILLWCTLMPLLKEFHTYQAECYCSRSIIGGYSPVKLLCVYASVPPVVVYVYGHCTAQTRV